MNNKETISRIAEIAFIAGELTSERKIDTGDRDLEQMYLEVYLPIWEEWSNESVRHCITEEEVGYISAYAQRVLLERYGA